MKHKAVRIWWVEKYEPWVECSCGYEDNSIEAKFCGGCGVSFQVPSNVIQEIENSHEDYDYILTEGKWYRMGHRGKLTAVTEDETHKDIKTAERILDNAENDLFMTITNTLTKESIKANKQSSYLIDFNI